jgi:lipopolysaccharide transport system ATP-binding protein
MEFAVSFEDVYKEYPFYQHITAGLKSFIFNLPRNITSLKKTRFIALKGVSFDVRKGETFGIIGRNGSGKSTILGLIAGVIRQDSGLIKTNGRISSLLELGAGFHPELSGVENIILNGILMGNTKKEMLKKADEIIEFSELGDFIYQPLRIYSSGMHVRLGFSVAVHIDPEILIVDEVLAVGDLNFQEKCLKKMKEFKESGATIIIVSHDMMSIAKLCDRAAWIDSGGIMAIEEPKEVIVKYIKYLDHPISPSIYEDQPVDEIENQPATAELSVSQIDSDFSQITVEPESLSQPTKPSSWWDSPVIMHRCETLITGDPDVHFYDFLRKRYMIGFLEKGLSICNRLKGIENNFILYGICKSFDIIDDENRLASLLSGTWDFKKDYYDLFLCIDILHRIKNLDLFLKDIDYAIKDKGVIIALEYIGPVNFQWSDKDVEIADMIAKAFNGKTGIANIESISMSSNKAENSINSMNVIPFIEKLFNIVAIRYFGGPLYDLLLNNILNNFDINEKKGTEIIKLIIQLEQILIKEGILENNYALIIAKKRSG